VLRPAVTVGGVTTTLALADELVGEPSLFAAWSSVAATDETLVVLAPGADAADYSSRIIAAAADADVDIESVDVVLLTAPLEPAEIRTLALSADAVLTGGSTPPDLAVLDSRLAA
jgi:siroheme synthase